MSIFWHLYNNEQFLTSHQFYFLNVFQKLYLSLPSKAIYGSLSINIPLTHLLCISSIEEGSPSHMLYYLLHSSCHLKEWVVREGGWYNMLCAYSSESYCQKQHFLLYTQYEQWAYVTVEYIPLHLLFLSWTMYTCISILLHRPAMLFCVNEVKLFQSWHLEPAHNIVHTRL
jgi:hypothetical protein